MSHSNPISWEELRREFDFTRQEEAEMAAGRSLLLAEVRAHKLAEIRRRRGETQVTVAQRMGVSPARVSAIEHGQVSMSEMDTLAAYVEALGGN